MLNRAGSDLGNLSAAAKTIQSCNRVLDGILERPLRSHLTVANLRNGQLILQADSPVWASRARLRLPEIRKAFEQRAPNLSITGVGLITRPRPPAAPGPAPRRAEISEASRKLLHDVAEDTDNPGLRRTLRRMARRDP